jgi:hypothetical protein
MVVMNALLPPQRAHKRDYLEMLETLVGQGTCLLLLFIHGCGVFLAGRSGWSQGNMCTMMLWKVMFGIPPRLC